MLQKIEHLIATAISELNALTNGHETSHRTKTFANQVGLFNAHKYLPLIEDEHFLENLTTALNNMLIETDWSYKYVEISNIKFEEVSYNVLYGELNYNKECYSYGLIIDSELEERPQFFLNYKNDDRLHTMLRTTDSDDMIHLLRK